MALLIYTEPITSRKRYVFTHIFNSILGVDVDFCDDRAFFNEYEGFKISYHYENLGDEICFEETELLSQKNIQKQDLDFAEYDKFEIPFKIKKSHFSFDVFAASFYFLSRYEEYVNPERDVHQRFEGKSALAFKNGFIRRPLIDEWAYKIAAIIKATYPEFIIKKRVFTYLPTLDIDRPFYYKTDAFLKKSMKWFLLKFKRDPFDVYDEVEKWDKQYGLETTYFILMGNKHHNDVAPAVSHPVFYAFLRRMALKSKIGIHPSYFSNQKSEEIEIEKNQLSQILKKNILISRQHYLMLNLPKTYRNLINVGLKEDYTLAFADVAGFRASTCSPFLWYDLEQDEISDLKLFPTAVMDQTLRRYMGLSSNEAILVIEELMVNVEKVNGLFISLWHNESINDFKVWKGWKKVYLNMLKKGSNK